MNYFLGIILILSLSIASIQIFHPEQYLISFFEKEETQEKEEIKTYSYSEHIARGNSYKEQGFVELARDEYLKAAQKNSNDPRAYFRLAETQELLRNFEGAIQNLQVAASLQNTTTIQTSIAKNLIHLKRFNEAETLLSKIEEKNSEAIYYSEILKFINQEISPDTKMSNTEIFPKAKAIQSAFDEFSLFQGGQNIYLQALVAKTLVNNGEYEIAIELLTKVLAKRSDYRDSWIMYGYAQMNLEDYEKAKEAFLKAYDLDPTKEETQYFLGIAFEETGEKDRALEFFQLAYKNGYKPKTHAIQKIADLSLEFGYYQEAFTLYEELLKIHHDDADNFIRPIWIAISQLSHLEKAQQMAEWAQAAYPQEAQSYNLLAWVAIEKGDFKTAQEQLNRAFSIDPDFAAAHYNQGLSFEKQGKIKKALSSYEKAYEEDRDGPIGNLAAEKYNKILNPEN